MKILARNKEANFNYKIEDTVEAGIVLKGHEVKSAKAGNVSLKGSYVSVRGGEAFLVNAHVSPYQKASQLEGYDPTQDRKLLLKREQLARLIGKSKEQGLALVPLDLHTQRGLVKVAIGIGRGKKKHDKRESIKKREADRKIQRAVRQSRQ
jgi:SsrA-binding protein